MLRRTPRVYFLRPQGKEGPVKIGHSRHPDFRLSQHMGWSPYPLEIAATIDGGRELEKRFHAKFIRDHSHREWFHPSRELSETIRRIQDGSFDPAELPEKAVRLRRAALGTYTDEFWRLSGALSSWLSALTKKGVEIPEDIKGAARRFSNSPYDPGPPGKRDLHDAEIVWRFLESCAPSPRSFSTLEMRKLLREAA